MLRRTKPVVFASALVLCAAGAALTAPAATAETNDDPATSALEALDARPQVALDAPGQQFKVAEVSRGPRGITHVRVDRTYRGLPVVGGDLVVHERPDGTLRGVSQTLGQPLSLATKPALSAEQAANSGLRLARRSDSSQRRRVGAPRLVIDALGDQARLAYEVTTRSIRPDGTPSEVVSYVDARTGKVLRAIEQVKTIDGTGRTLYAGNVPLQVAKGSWGQFVLRDDTRGGSQVFTLKNTYPAFCWLNGTCGNGAAITSSSTTFGNNSASNRATVGADAAYGQQQFWDFFKTKFGRLGVANDGAPLIAQVNYGMKIANAFWQGGRATFGDGDSTYRPLVDVDVVAHEFAHGITEATAGLIYDKESGHLNESTSDIFGAMVEFYANNPNNNGDYFVGDKLVVNSTAGMRRMDKPSADGLSPECYSSAVTNLDVHYGSGIGNKFFYLLAEGSGAKTINGLAHSASTCDGSVIAGIGREKAAAIWYTALTSYFTANTDYAAARQGTIRAATDLYGANSTEVATVAKAWSAVGV